MASFFGKPKVPAASTSGSSTAAGLASIAAKEQPEVVSEFEKVFKPFLLKKDTTLAPTNWFVEVRAWKTYKGKEKENAVIVIDDDEDVSERLAKKAKLQEDEDVQMVDASEWKGHDMDLGQKTAKGKSAKVIWEHAR